LLRPARRRRGPPLPARVLRGEPAELAFFEEEGLRYAVDLAEGHKTGTYLDLRALRRAVATAPLAGARVLNLFAYTGMLGRAAEAAGAASITHVDQSQRALDFAAAHHVTDPARHTFVAADIFRWLPALDPAEQYDVVIVDPPAMTSRASQVPNVLAAYRKLYRAAEAHVRPGGLLVSACCSSRVPRDVFRKTVRGALPERFTLERDLPPEPDHPVGYAQADYLKILLWRAGV
jgi:23S rRNA (cytosine1962-C5)-methyltransferase